MIEKKKLLIFAHYYVPDVASTGQILRELAEGILDAFDVTVICVVPSYGGKVEDRYKTKMFYEENINGVRVLRIRVPEFSKSNKISRIKNILAYFFGAMIATFKVGKQDFVFSISQPPVLGGLLGIWGKLIKHARYIYNIQDFNPELIMAINYSKNKAILKLMMWFDKLSCRFSDLVVTVGSDLVETMNKRFKGKNVPKTVMINNWVNEQEIYPLHPDNEGVLAFRRQYGLNDKFVIMYSGNIGFYYDLENLIEVIRKFEPGTTTPDGREVVFAFVGAGSVLDKLKQYVEEYQMDNVVFIPYQNKKELVYSINAGDVHWCVNAKGIKGVSCPSKWYGQAAAARPILGVLEEGSEIRMLIEKTKCGLVSAPEDYEAVERNIRWFINNADSKEIASMGKNGHDYLVKNLTKGASITKYKRFILAMEKEKTTQQLIHMVDEELESSVWEKPKAVSRGVNL